MMATPSSEPPILSRLDRLDLMLRYLEEMRRSSFTSTASSGDGDAGEGGGGGGEYSPLSASAKRINEKKKARPMAEVAAEAQMKGSLLDRLTQLEHRILKLSMRVEEEIESEKKSTEEEFKSPRGHGEKKRHKLKLLVKSCVKGRSTVKDKDY